MASTFTAETGDLTLVGTNKEKRMSIASSVAEDLRETALLCTAYSTGLDFGLNH